MSNRGRITRECELLNRKRNVFEGIIDNRSFFQNIRGDLLVSGERAGDQEMILNLVESCMEKADMPIILLSGHLGVFTELQRRRTQDAFSNVRIASPSEKRTIRFLECQSSRSRDLSALQQRKGNRSFNRKSNDLYSGIAGYRCCKISGFSAGYGRSAAGR